MILCFVLVMSILNLIKEGWRFFLSFRNDQKYISSNTRTSLTFASIAAIISISIFGF